MTRKYTVCALALGIALSLGLATAQAGSQYQLGDVFAAIGNGQVAEYTPTGVLVQTLNDGSGSTFTTGMAFDTSGNLYVTNFSTGTISQLDSHGNITNTNFITGLNNPESIVFTQASQFFVGDAGSNLIHQYNNTGGLLNTYTSTLQNRGTDWIDLASDQHTILYTSEGSSVLSFNTAANTQNPNFADGLPGANAYALRQIDSGAFAGDVLVADSSNALLLSSAGAILTTYNLPGNGGGDFSLNLDPLGTAFWTGDFVTGLIWQVDIASGTILNQFSSGSGSLFGITVFGEKGQPPPVPEPTTMVLLGTGLMGFLTKKFKKS